MSIFAQLERDTIADPYYQDPRLWGLAQTEADAQFDPYKFALNAKAQIEAHAEADTQNPNKLYWAQRCFADPSGRGCKKRMADFCRGMPNHPFCRHEYTGLAQTEADAQNYSWRMAKQCIERPNNAPPDCKEWVADFCRDFPRYPFCVHEYTGLAQTEADAQAEQYG